MSIQSEITRLENAKTAISEAIASKGVSVPSSTKMDGMADFINDINTGGDYNVIITDNSYNGQTVAIVNAR